MTYKFKNNTACRFHDVNQNDENISKMMCTIYYAFINAKYNWVIKSFTEDGIKNLASRQFSLWKFSYENGWRLDYWLHAVIDYIKTDMGIECNLATFTKDSDLEDWLNRWFAVWIGIKVNKTFLQDKKDWKLDLLDYKGYKWNIWHATNIIRWMCRWEDVCSTKWKEMFLDSYFVKNSTYECDIKEVLSEIEMETKYIIF